MDSCLQHLIARMKDYDAFPHEIGCFLGYPAEDVLGFIRKEECKYRGIWKVYGDVEYAKNLFAIYDRCTKSYMSRYLAGETLDRLVKEGNSYE